MGLMEWNASYSVNVKEIDEQHKKLISLLNKLYEAMREGKGKAILKDVLSELLAYTDNHFKYEEELFEKHGYTNKAPHLKEHENLKKKVIDLQKNFEKGNAVITLELLDFLMSWVENHILKVDKQYTPFLNSKGVY